LWSPARGDLDAHAAAALNASPAVTAAGHLLGHDCRAALTRLFDHYLHAAALAMDTLYPAERHHWRRVPAPSTAVPPVIDPATYAADDRPGHATLLSATLFPVSPASSGTASSRTGSPLAPRSPAITERGKARARTNQPMASPQLKNCQAL